LCEYNNALTWTYFFVDTATTIAYFNQHKQISARKPNGKTSRHLGIHVSELTLDNAVVTINSRKTPAML
jgi:hypothetical protein